MERRGWKRGKEKHGPGTQTGPGASGLPALGFASQQPPLPRGWPGLGVSSPPVREQQGEHSPGKEGGLKLEPAFTSIP